MINACWLDCGRRAWLIPLPVRGTYEFLPAESGPNRAGDPLTEAAAALKRDPGLRLQLVLGGAAFLGGFNERAPLRYTLIVPKQAPIQRGLAHAYDLIRAAPSRFFGATPRDGVAMSGASRLLFDAALWPTRAGDLRDPDHWLRAALARAEIADILAFAQRLDSDRVTARAGYFAEAFGRSDIAASLADLHPKAAVRLGDPAGPLSRPRRVLRRARPPRGRRRVIYERAITLLSGRYGGRAAPQAYLEFAQEHFLAWMATEGLFAGDHPLIFKGGTALRKFRFGLPGRFSTDLDFAAESTDYPEHVLDSLEEGFSFEGVTFHLTDLDRPALKGTWGAQAEGIAGETIDAKLDFSPRPTLYPPERRPRSEIPGVERRFLELRCEPSSRSATAQGGVRCDGTTRRRSRLSLRDHSGRC